MFLIDPYVTYPDFEKDSPESYAQLIKAEEIALKRLGKYNNTVWLKDFSDRAVNKIHKCDFIYIDGNHSYEYVKRGLISFWKSK